MCREQCRPCDRITCDLTQSCALKQFREHQPLGYTWTQPYTYARRTMRPKRRMLLQWLTILAALLLASVALLFAAAWMLQLAGRIGGKG